MNNKSTLSVLLGILAMGLAKKNSSGSSVRLVRGFRPIVDCKFRIAVDTNIDFSEYFEDEEDKWAKWNLFPDDLKVILLEYFRKFSKIIDDLDTAEYGLEDFSFFLLDSADNFIYKVGNRILFDFWFIFDKPFVASSEEEFESIFDLYVSIEPKLDLMFDFIENKLMSFKPNVDSGLEIFDTLEVNFLGYEWVETEPCLIDVETGKKYKTPKYKKSNLRKR